MESVFVSFWRFHSSFSDVSTLPLPYRHRKHTLFYVSTHEVRKKTRVFVFKAHHRFTGWTNRVTQKAGSGKALANQDLLSSTAETRCNQFLKEKRLTCLLLFFFIFWFFCRVFYSFTFLSLLFLHSYVFTVFLPLSFIIFSTFLLFHFCLTILPSFLIFLSYSLFFFSGLMPLVFSFSWQCFLGTLVSSYKKYTEMS